jgi:hypothetical protein
LAEPPDRFQKFKVRSLRLVDNWGPKKCQKYQNVKNTRSKCVKTGTLPNGYPQPKMVQVNVVRILKENKSHPRPFFSDVPFKSNVQKTCAGGYPPQLLAQGDEMDGG